MNDKKCICERYADELKFYAPLETDADVSYLQENFTNVYDLSYKWQLLEYRNLNVFLCMLVTHVVTRTCFHMSKMSGYLYDAFF